MINELAWEDKMLASPLEEDEEKVTFHDVDRQRVCDLYQQLKQSMTLFNLRRYDSEKTVDAAVDDLLEKMDELEVAIQRYRGELTDREQIKWFDEDDKWQIEEGLVRL